METKDKAEKVIDELRLSRTKYKRFSLKYEGHTIGIVDASKGLDGLKALILTHAHNILPAILRGNKVVIEAD